MTGGHATSGPVEAAEAFVRAIVWGEHSTVWELLSAQGRRFALSVATGNGLDRVVAGRIEQDLADPVEFDEFQAQVLGGLRRDLRSVDLDHIAVNATGAGSAAVGDTRTVTLTTPSVIPGTSDWVAGELVLSFDDGRWRVDRLIPRIAGP